MGKIWNMSDEGKQKISKYAQQRYKDNSLVTVCNRCGKRYRIAKSRFDNGRGKYCSKECQYLDKRGVRYSPATEFQKGNNLASKNYKWKGDNVTVASLHNYINRNFLKPDHCEICGVLRSVKIRFEWSNKSQKYNTKDRNDWQYICRKCHVKYDRIVEKAWRTKKSKLLEV